MLYGDLSPIECSVLKQSLEITHYIPHRTRRPLALCLYHLIIHVSVFCFNLFYSGTDLTVWPPYMEMKIPPPIHSLMVSAPVSQEKKDLPFWLRAFGVFQKRFAFPQCLLAQISWNYLEGFWSLSMINIYHCPLDLCDPKYCLSLSFFARKLTGKQVTLPWLISQD